MDQSILGTGPQSHVSDRRRIGDLQFHEFPKTCKGKMTSFLSSHFFVLKVDLIQKFLTFLTAMPLMPHEAMVHEHDRWHRYFPCMFGREFWYVSNLAAMGSYGLLGACLWKKLQAASLYTWYELDGLVVSSAFQNAHISQADFRISVTGIYVGVDGREYRGRWMVKNSVAVPHGFSPHSKQYDKHSHYFQTCEVPTRT